MGTEAVGIMELRDSNGNRYAVEAWSKNYKIREIMEILQTELGNGCEIVNFQTGQDGELTIDFGTTFYTLKD